MTRVPPHISASQIATSRQCLRRWWFEKVRGLTSPGTAATLFGSTLHAVVEGYLLKMNEQQLTEHIRATVPDTTSANIKKAKDLLAVAIPAAVLPPPGSGRVEEEMVIPFPPMPGGLKGRLDYVDLQRAVPLVLDHKTTSDPAYAKTEETLRSDPQVILYSRWALLQCPNADYVDVRYVYYLTKGGSRVWAVDIRLTREEVEASFAWLSEEISKMVSAFGEEDPGRLDFKLSACNSYGRACPAMGQCPAHAKPETPQTQTGADRLRALRTAHASQCNVPTTSAAYAAIPKESNMSSLTTGQIKIAFMNFGKILADSGVSADTRAAVQEDVLANPDMVGPVESLPAISDELKKLAPATPANAVGAMTQWILNECRRRERKAKEAEANLAAATAAEPAVFEDVTLSDEQAEYKDMLEELGYPGTEAIRMVLRELDRAADIVANAIRYTGTDEDEDEEVPVAAPPPQRGSPLAGRATTVAPAVVSPAPEQPPAAPANTAAFADLIAGLSGGGAALTALQSAYASLSGDDLTTVDAWLVSRQGQLGKSSLAPFLVGFCNGIDSSKLQQTNNDVESIREVYLTAATAIKDKARVRDIESQMPAIVRLLGGAQTANGGYTLPFRSAAASAAAKPPAEVAPPAAKPAATKAKPVAETAPAASPAPAAAPPPAAPPAPVETPTKAPASEATRLDVFIDIALVRGPLPSALPLSDLWMNAVVAATEAADKDPRLDQFGSALKPVALAVTREIASRLSDGSITLIVDSQSQAWKLCGDEITAIADVVLRGY